MKKLIKPSTSGLTIFHLFVFTISLLFVSCGQDPEQTITPKADNKVPEQQTMRNPGPIKVKEVGVKASWYLYKKSKNCLKGFAICKLKKAGPYIKFKTGFVYIPNNNQMHVLIDQEHTLPEQSMTFLPGEDCYPDIDAEVLQHFGFSSLAILPGTYDFITNEDGDHEVIVNISAE
jgi:hypothetical protein